MIRISDFGMMKGTESGRDGRAIDDSFHQSTDMVYSAA